MITIGESAQSHFRRLIEQQDLPGLGVRLRVVRAGTPKADCELTFCEPSDLAGDELELELDGFSMFVDAASAPFLEQAVIDIEKNATGGSLTIKAPRIKGTPPGAEASLIERIRYVIESEINPGLASHGGRVTAESLEADGTLVLRFGGGCHGCHALSRNGRHMTVSVNGQRDGRISIVDVARLDAIANSPQHALQTEGRRKSSSR